MENNKHNLVAAWILTILSLIGLFFVVLLFLGANDILSSNNAIGVLFGGTIMLVLYFIALIPTIGFVIYPVVRTTKLLFVEKDRRVPVWILFALSIGTVVALIVLTILIF